MNLTRCTLTRIAPACAVAITLISATTAPRPAMAQGTASVTVRLRNAVTDAPVPDATVRALPSARSCVTRGDGGCRLVVGSSDIEVRVTAIGYAPASQAISLRSGQTVVLTIALVPGPVGLNALVTIGTRAEERSLSRSPVPVDVISSQLLENTGLDETWQQLQRLVPSVNTPHIPIGDNHMRPVTLRGMAPHHTLVLVNGKRRHPAAPLLAGPSVPFTALTDLSAIPNTAIERIEVLRDGASAQYGSDAIGGVMNVVLKSGERRDARAMFGTVHSTEGGRDFRDGRLLSVGTTVGFSMENGGHVTMSGEVRDRGGTNRAYPDMRPQYFTGDPRNDAAPRVSSYLGNGEVSDLQFFLSAASPIGDLAELYAFGGIADRNAVSPDAFFRRPRDRRTVRAIHPDGFLPVVESDIGDVSAIGGLRGSFRGWRWDLSSGWGANRIAYTVRNSNNVSLGAASPTEFYAGRIGTGQWSNNLDVSRKLRIGSMPASFAGGAEFRVDRYTIRAGEPDSWRDGEVRILDGPDRGRPADVGSQGMVGYRPIDEVSANRNNLGLYLEGDVSPVSRVLLQTAVRSERYSDFGSTYDGKVAARMEVTRGVALRGALSTGFRAPALTQQYFSSTRTVYRQSGGVNRVFTVRTFPVGTAEAKLMGAAPLRPEQALNRSVGLAFDRPRLPLLTIDYYQIDIEDRIGLRNSITDTSIVRLFEENGMRGIEGGNYFANSRDTRTRGLDAIASHNVVIRGASVLRVSAGYNRTRNQTTRVAPLPPPLERFDTARVSRGGVLENGQPRQTFVVTLNYAVGPLGLNVNSRRSGPTAQIDATNPDADQIVRARWISDLGISYRLRKRLQLSAGAANLFDVYPDEWFDFKDGVNAQGPSMQGIFRHPGGLSTFGMNGRTLYLRLVHH